MQNKTTPTLEQLKAAVLFMDYNDNMQKMAIADYSKEAIKTIRALLDAAITPTNVEEQYLYLDAAEGEPLEPITPKVERILAMLNSTNPVDSNEIIEVIVRLWKATMASQVALSSQPETVEPAASSMAGDDIKEVREAIIDAERALEHLNIPPDCERRQLKEALEILNRMGAK